MPDNADRTAQRLQRELGYRVGELRRALGITQLEAARRMRMAADNYIRIERGKRNLTLHTITRLALMLDVNVRDLFAPPAGGPPKPGRPSTKR